MNFERFVIESNRIEGILRPPTDIEIEATREFIVRGPAPSIVTVATLALIYAPDKGFLRNQKGMDVRVGSHTPPRGGPNIYRNLVDLLATIEEADPFEFHIAYETLHPFMDGNGRTGRALWAWQMLRHPTKFQMTDLGFLHAFYYQTLSAQR